MPQIAVAARDNRTDRYPLDAFLNDIAGVEATTDIIDLRRKSRDFF